MNLFSFIIALVGPVMTRILASLGLSLVSVAGMAGAVTALRSYIVTNASAAPSDGLMLAGLLGLWECLAIILAGVSFVVAWNSSAGFWKLAKVSP